MKLSKAISEFIENAEKNKRLSVHTIRAYDTDLRCFQKLTGNIQIACCGRTNIVNYKIHVQDTLKLKPASVKRRLATLRCFLNWLVDEDLADPIRAKRKDFLVKLPRQLPRAITKEDVSRLLKQPLIDLGHNTRLGLLDSACESNHTPARFRQITTLVCLDLLYSTGIRVCELCRIHISDIDLMGQRIRIKGKGQYERTVFIPTRIVARTLKMYMHVRAHLAPNTSTLVVRANASSADTQYIRKLVHDVTAAAKIDKTITPHMLRHTAATHLVYGGLDIRYIQKLLGHQSITTTQRYTHVADRDLQQYINTMHPIGEIIM